MPQFASTLRFVLLSIVVLSCGQNNAPSQHKHCYRIEDGAERSIIVIESKSPMPTVTVMNPDGSDPVETVGRIESGVFFYPTGSKLHFDTQAVKGEGGLIEGITGTKTDCP